VRRAGGAAAVAAIVLSSACGSGVGKTASTSPLAWKGHPKAFRQPDLPSDRVVLSAVRNISDKPLSLSASRLVVRDAAGKTLPSSAQFVAGYAHGLYGAFQKPSPLPPDELRRLGLVVTVAPGATVPLTVAWRLGKGSREPASIDYGAGRLQLPVGTAPAGA